MAKGNPDAIALVQAINSTLLRREAIRIVAEALRKTSGNVKAAAMTLGLNPRPVYRVIERAPELEKLVDRLRDKAPPIPRPSRRKARRRSRSG